MVADQTAWNTNRHVQTRNIPVSFLLSLGDRGKRRKTDEGFSSSPETPRGSPQFTTSRTKDPPCEEEEEDYDSWEIGISDMNDEGQRQHLFRSHFLTLEL